MVDKGGDPGPHRQRRNDQAGRRHPHRRRLTSLQCPLDARSVADEIERDLRAAAVPGARREGEGLPQERADASRHAGAGDQEGRQEHAARPPRSGRTTTSSRSSPSCGRRRSTNAGWRRSSSSSSPTRSSCSDDIELVERLIRESKTWALVDTLAVSVTGGLIERDPSLCDVLDRWSTDDDFWIRRASMLALLGPLRRGEGDFERFARYADAMLEEKEFFIRKGDRVGAPRDVEEATRPRLRVDRAPDRPRVRRHDARGGAIPGARRTAMS